MAWEEVEGLKVDNLLVVVLYEYVARTDLLGVPVVRCQPWVRGDDDGTHVGGANG